MLWYPGFPVAPHVVEVRDALLFSQSPVHHWVMVALVAERSPVNDVLFFTDILNAGCRGMVLHQVCLKQAGLKQVGI